MVFQQSGFSSLDELEAARSSAVAGLDSARAALRAVENTLKEKKELRGHLLSYRKGQPLRDELKSLPSTPARAEFRKKHESDFTSMDADLRYFKAHGVTRFPAVKSVQAEIEGLIAEKNRLYLVYRDQKQRTMELQTIWDNICSTLPEGQKKACDLER